MPIDELLAGEPDPITRIKPSCGTDRETFERDGLLLVRLSRQRASAAGHPTITSADRRPAAARPGNRLPQLAGRWHIRATRGAKEQTAHATVELSFARPSRSALVTTEAELRLIASAATIGDSSQPVKG